MTTFILHPAGEGTQVVPWVDATPSARKAHRGTGVGFTVTAKDEGALRRSLRAYFPD